MAAIGTISADERNRVAEVVARLQSRFAEVAPDRVAEVVSQVHQEFGAARVRDFIPVLVESRARDQLANLSR